MINSKLQKALFKSQHEESGICVYNFHDNLVQEVGLVHV